MKYNNNNKYTIAQKEIDFESRLLQLLFTIEIW